MTFFFFSSIFSVRSTNIVRTIESAKCLVAGLFQQKQKGRVEIHMCQILLDLFWILSNLFLSFSPLFEDIVPILTTEAESEILYPNYHACKMLKILGGYVEYILIPGSRSKPQTSYAHATQNWNLEKL